MAGRKTRLYSFEFYPPKTPEAGEQFLKAVDELAPLGPHFVSVTFGAGGSTREGTYQTVCQIMRTSQLRVVPHLSCMGVSREEICNLLDTYAALGMRKIVALRGDLPKDEQHKRPQTFAHANDLVAFIKKTKAEFSISVACYPEFHPESPDPQTDIDNFVRKVGTGADEAITQYFFNNEAYYLFVDTVRKKGVEIPIVPGLMPIVGYEQIARFSSFCGADIPVWIRKRMEAFAGDPASQKALGIEIATRQAEDLLKNGAPGLHFYTLNKSEATLRVWKNLGLSGEPMPGLASTTKAREKGGRASALDS
jgi:methylenetetrahydrofolate reductase (NADPH)